MSTDLNNTNPPAPPSSAGSPSRLQDMAVPAIYTLATLLMVVAVLAFLAWLRSSWNTLPYSIWALVVSVFIYIAAGLASMSRRESWQWTPEERQRAILLAVMGIFGFALASLGLALPFAYPEIFSGQLATWREHKGPVLGCAALVLGGLFVLILGLVMGRDIAARYANLRRTVAGYNAMAGTLLLLVILILANLMSYINFGPLKALGQTYDWTSSRLYSLSDASKQVLTNLKQPVKVYAITTRNSLLTPEIETLLENCRSVTPMLSWELVSRDLQRREFARLDNLYQLPGDGLGLLVIYGTDEKAAHEFIPSNDLYENASMTAREGTRFQFKGESALIKAIKFLSQGQSKGKIYFTQGSGEMEFGGLGMGMDTRRQERSLSTLKQDLEKRNYDARSLVFGTDTTIPEDADIIVVVAPMRELPAKAVAALRDYLHGTGRKEKGRLIVLMPPAGDPRGRPIRTGLEGLLNEFHAKVGVDRVMAFRAIKPPLTVIATANPRVSNPIARAFVDEIFAFDDSRSVAAQQSTAPGGGMTAEEILVVPFGLQVWVETNLEADPMALANEIAKSPELQRQKLRQEPVPVAVAVSEGTPPMNIPGHPPMGGSEIQPRLVVFGSASWVADPSMSGAQHSLNLDLFTSSLSWLRKKADIGVSAEAKERKEYRPNVPPGGGIRIIVLPITIGLLAVLMLGGAVWVVRRR